MAYAILRCVAFALLLFAMRAHGAAVVTEHVRAELLADAPEGVRPGKQVWLGLAIEHQPHWHTYWKNPGDSGLPTTLSWTLPAGFSASDILWPAPKRLPLGPLMNYGYEGKLLLPVLLTVPSGFKADALDIKLRADWLVCKEICLPESGEFSLRLDAGPAPGGPSRALFDAARAAQPQTLAGVSAKAGVDGPALAAEVSGLPASMRGRQLHFYSELGGVIDHAAAVESRWDGDRVALRIPLSVQRSESPASLGAVLAAEGVPAVRVDIAVSGGWPDVGAAAGPAPAPLASPSSTPALTYVLALALAFAGGALLNLMPCVFPVLSLKVLAFAQHATDRRRAVAGGLAYTSGVVASFLLLAGLLLALRAGGEQLGWGFQLQSPLFVAALAVLFTLIGLNLADVFQFGSVLPGSLAAFRARHPLADDALSGALAVAIASPCSAPFMGAALGAALAMPAPAALSVFAALGLGMAAPYLAASLWPGMARLLPRPGAWMARFKTVMAFPMFATVVWLVWILGQQAGIDGAVALLGVLVALAYAAWTLGTPVAGGAARVGLLGSGVVVLVLACGWAWPALNMEAGAQTAAPAGRWQPWSVEAVAQARREGRPVFIDFTAAWCVTCQFNKRTALADPALLASFDAQRVLLLRADWTRRDAAITQELGQLGRNGVPVYALYGPGGGAPQLLSEILTVAEVNAALAKI